ncbi:MAG: hypothetical protein INR62_07400 [Rhodospirillales bacterium]|nr:hypothetical protein [Acetobacter sp.]
MDQAGGQDSGLEAFMGFDRAGATCATILKVAVASHTPLLAEASRRFGEVLAGLAQPGRVPGGRRLLSGVDGDPVFSVAEGATKLAAQISSTLQ